ncbi:MAG: hemerythrin domain-containing protein [Hydrogenophaga sp.]|uniref:bacteriohemerythrin n=1 Tax=Hydrogenophaga sp. TaxID=1904254 RepID=UPI001D214E7E|nr:hemerythrin domain-containing protein [Hydrogenophaga sp.]MBX3610091.1 hemerythrin domain-containing protein [Hydrogenophaga sp.]
MDTTLASPADTWRTGDVRMDDTHEEFLALVDDLRQASPDTLLPLFERLIAHTEAHFAQEERWLQAIGFSAQNCHAMQHAAVLDTLLEVFKRAGQGQTGLVAQMLDALAEWFPQHAASMDAGLAQLMRQAGFDSASESFASGAAFTPANPGGCGSLHCS